MLDNLTVLSVDMKANRLILIALLLVASLSWLNLSYANQDAGKIKVLNHLILVENGQTNYQIVIAKNALQGVKQAAKELQRLIKKSTGADIKVATFLAKGKRYVFVGKSAFTEQAGMSDIGLKMDSYHISVKGQNVYLVGYDDKQQGFFTLNTKQSASAGTYYAVIDFARRFLNARWYMPGPLGEELDTVSSLLIPADLDLMSGPYFGMRYIDIATTKNQKKENNLRKQGRIKGRYFDAQAAKLSTQWGRHLRLGSNFQLSVGHSWYQWLPAEKPSNYSADYYGRSNPEFYAKPGGSNFLSKYYYGKGNNHGGQLCICNSEVVNTFADNIITYAKKTGERSFSLSPNDGGWGECSCHCCLQNSSRFEKNTAELTEEMINFSNQVVNRVLKQIPDATFGLYLYNDMSVPSSKGKASEKIYLSDVYNGLAYIHHLSDERLATESEIKLWRDRAGSIVLTTYYTFYGHYSLPWSTIDTQKWLFEQFLRNHASSGLRMNYALMDSPPMGSLGPDPWVLSELLWNPDQSITVLENEYYSRTFGAEAGTLIQKYFALISASMKVVINEFPFSRASGVKNYIIPAYGPIRNKCRELIDAAVITVSKKDKRYQWRVDRIARAWLLAELTLDMLQAEKGADKEKLHQLINLRRAFLMEKENIFAISPISTEYQESIAPLVSN